MATPTPPPSNPKPLTTASATGVTAEQKATSPTKPEALQDFCASHLGAQHRTILAGFAAYARSQKWTHAPRDEWQKRLDAFRTMEVK